MSEMMPMVTSDIATYIDRWEVRPFIYPRMGIVNYFLFENRARRM
jgi:hypothetical protein